jgi:hypothetical protein
MTGFRRRRLVLGVAATAVWLIAATLLVTFGGAIGSPGTAAAAQYKPPAAPTTILSGLSQPAEVAADGKGNLWFTQGAAPASTTVTLYVLATGSSNPVAVHSAAGGDGSITPFITDLAFDAADNPHFVQWTGSGASHDSSLIRLDAATGTTTALASESGTHDANGGLTSGSAIAQTEIGADGTVYWMTLTIGGSGNSEVRIDALAPGASTPSLVTEFATAGVNHASTGFDVASDGTVYLQELATVPGSPGASSIGVYRIAPGGTPEPIRVFPDQANGPRPFYVGLDGKDNLIIGERIINGFVRPGCAESTTFQLIRYDAASLAGPAPVGTVYSSAWYPGFQFVFVGSSTYFRVSADGDVLFGLYESDSASRCANPPGDIRFTHLRMIGVSGKDADGTQHVLFDDAPSPPAIGFYSFAFSGNDAYATSSRLGTLSRIDLNKNAKKPK